MAVAVVGDCPEAFVAVVDSVIGDEYKPLKNGLGGRFEGVLNETRL